MCGNFDFHPIESPQGGFFFNGGYAQMCFDCFPYFFIVLL